MGLTRINVKMRCGDETEVNGQGPEIKSEDIAELYEKLGYLDHDDYLVLARQPARLYVQDNVYGYHADAAI